MVGPVDNRKSPEYLHLQGEPEQLGLKHMTEQELLGTLLQYGEHWSDNDRNLVLNSYFMARKLHIDDSYKELPYTYHLLRNANRVTGYLHITDPEIIAAVLLHDSVEDRAEDIVLWSGHIPKDQIPTNANDLQTEAFNIYTRVFGQRVSRLVSYVTNEPTLPNSNLTSDQKLEIYANKVKMAVKTPEGWIIKFVDWEDNGLGIIHDGNETNREEKKPHFERKYGYVQPTFESRFYHEDIQTMLDPMAKQYVMQQFKLGRQRLLVPTK